MLLPLLWRPRRALSYDVATWADLNASPQLQHEAGLDSYEGSTDWAYNDDTAIYRHMISTAPYTQSFDPDISTPAGTEQSNECPALSSPILCEALPYQKERVRKRSPSAILYLVYSDFQP
jgi:hypothetical protein